VEYLITNIASDEVPYDEMKAFYYQRWEIERVFNLLKNRLHIEDIGARTPAGVQQEIQATVFLGNIVEDIVVDMNKKLPQSEKNKHRYYVNVNLLCGVVKNYFLLIYYIEGLSVEMREWHYKRLIGFIKQTAIAKNIGDKNPRIKRVSRNKYKTNIRNSY
jgi:IS4 transposase